MGPVNQDHSILSGVSLLLFSVRQHVLSARSCVLVYLPIVAV